MSDKADQTVAPLEELINYRFKDKSILAEALTHPSFINESGGRVKRDNQRLEFLGDAVIGMILSLQLFHQFPDSHEGDLTKLRSAMVDEATLSSLAAAVQLGSYLRLGRGEDKSGGRSKQSLLADAYEALLAAVYLDGGIEAATVLVSRHFSPLLEKIDVKAVGKDFKTELQELAHQTRNLAPRYLLQRVSGPDHMKTFSVAVFLGDELLGEGSARSKKEAEQAAAREGITLLKRGCTS